MNRCCSFAKQKVIRLKVNGAYPGVMWMMMNFLIQLPFERHWKKVGLKLKPLVY